MENVLPLSIQMIFILYMTAYVAAGYRLTPIHEKVVWCILNCRTAAMGGHWWECPFCGYYEVQYNSCGNRCCPVCQERAREKWLSKEMDNLLDVPYFHLIFTVPNALNSLFLNNQKLMYDMLMKASSQTVLELCKDPKYLGAVPGITSVLHTWGQTLAYHPHVHMMVTGGGLDKRGDEYGWKPLPKENFFIPVRVLSSVFRGKFMDLLKKSFPDLDPSLIDECYAAKWVVHCKSAPGKPEIVLNYLSRYIFRVAISNNRIKKIEDGYVTFSWKDYKDGGKTKLMTITAVEFIRRYLMHVLPLSFHKVRHYGIYSSRGKKGRLEFCRRVIRSGEYENSTYYDEEIESAQRKRRKRKKKEEEEEEKDYLDDDDDDDDDDDYDPLHPPRVCPKCGRIRPHQYVPARKPRRVPYPGMKKKEKYRKNRRSRDKPKLGKIA